MKKIPVFNVILLGDPGSGKGTQAARLVKHYRLHDFDMGEELRKPNIIKQFNFAKTTGVGHLAPTDIVRGILEDTIKKTSPSRGILFNGTPKMIGEARLTVKWLKEAKRANPLVLYLSIPRKEVLNRVLQRSVRVDGKIVKRDDDTKRALENRRAYYREQVSRVIVFFKKKYEFKKISGLGTEAEVAKRIVVEVERYLHKNNFV
jgi:adenylate kinase